jgi:DNA-binding transcriptional LysR family regulator
MDLWQLHVFCKVVELESFSKAGGVVHLSQPTVSSHIKDLEDYIGCRLIDRLPKKACPTKAGELLYDYAKKLLSLRDDAESALAEFQGAVKGRLVMGGSTIPGVYILPQYIGAFAKTYSDVTISLVLGDTESITSGTIEGTLEFGVVGARVEDSRIIQEPLIQDDMRIIVPASHTWAERKSISLGMLQKEPFIIREKGSGTLQSIQQRFLQKGHNIEELNIVAEMGSTEAVRQAIKAHAGVSILSTLAVSEDLQTGRLKALEIKGVNLKRRFYLTRHQQRTPSPLCRTFIDFLKKNITTL